MTKNSISKKDEGFKVVGYFPAWEAEKRNRIRYNVVTHIIYSFAIPNDDGTLNPLENSENASALITEAHKNGVKVLLAVGGWSYNGNPLEPIFKSATDTPEKIVVLTSSIMELVNEYGFDGVDIDWEHPRYNDISQTQYISLLKSLRCELDKNNLLLTSAVLSGVTADGNIMPDAAAHSDEVIETVNWLNIMAYDGGDGDRHSSYEFAVNCGNYWGNTRNIAKDKYVLGVPFYGRPSWSSYDALVYVNPDADKSDTTTINGIEAHYNGVETIIKKTEWALKNAGGIMIWELSQDCIDENKSLLNAIGRTVR